MEDYEKLLEKAYKEVKQIKGSGERFEIPKAEGRFEGRKTIITNFLPMANYLRRSPAHFQKFILKELAASGQIEGEKLVLNMKVPSSRINQKIEEYTKEFVICKECGKPDSELIKEERISFIHCLACGAKHSVRGKI